MPQRACGETLQPAPRSAPRGSAAALFRSTPLPVNESGLSQMILTLIWDANSSHRPFAVSRHVVSGGRAVRPIAHTDSEDVDRRYAGLQTRLSLERPVRRRADRRARRPGPPHRYISHRDEEHHVWAVVSAGIGEIGILRHHVAHGSHF